MEFVLTQKCQIRILRQTELEDLFYSLDKVKQKKHLSNSWNLKVGELKDDEWCAFRSQNKDVQVIIRMEDGNPIRYQCNTLDDAKNKTIERRRDSLSILKKKFQEEHGVGILSAFGRYPDKEILKCVPKALCLREQWGEYRGPVSCADFSSQFSSCFCGRMPDAKTMKRIKGTVPPTKEYPFAIYVKSGHSAEYGVYDTHSLLSNKYLINLFRWHPNHPENDDKQEPFTDPKEDITVLFKASKYTWDSIMQYYYDIKQKKYNTSEYEDAKLIVNSSIGKLHPKKYDKRNCYAHLVVFIIGRSNQKMLDAIKGVDLIQACVDGILYRGNNVIGSETPKLGELVQIATNRPCRWIHWNRYMIDMGDHMIVKHAAMNARTDGIDIEETKSFEEMDLWCMIRKKGTEVPDYEEDYEEDEEESI